MIVLYLGTTDRAAAADSALAQGNARSMKAIEEMQHQAGLPAEARRRLEEAQGKLLRAAARQPARQAIAWLLWAGIAWIGFDFALLAGIVLVVRSRGAAKGKKLLGLLERGQVASAQVVANQVDYSIRVNGAPRRIIVLAIAGQQVELRTFDNNYANLFAPNATIEVLHDPGAPGLVFPTAEIPAL
jgi:hypothetical protein